MMPFVVISMLFAVVMPSSVVMNVIYNTNFSVVHIAIGGQTVLPLQTTRQTTVQQQQQSHYSQTRTCHFQSDLKSPHVLSSTIQ